jgi:4-amino-4-deoxy-L-arabinose transferase-like glycosyltransferase
MKAANSYLVGLAAACLMICWAIDLFYFPGTTVFPDEDRILASAVRLAHTGEFWVGDSRAWEMPGAAIFFAGPASIFRTTTAIVAARILQSFLLVLQVLLIAFIARRIFRDTFTSLIAATVAAFYPFFLYYQGLLLTETLFNTFVVAGFAALYEWRERGAKIDRLLVLACACFAAATWTKATLTFLPPVLLAAAALVGPDKIRRAAITFVVSALLYAGFLSPWWIRNYNLLGAFVPFTTTAGQNLYLGNNPANTTGGIDWNTDVQPEVVARIQAIPNEIERQRAYGDAAKAYIQSEPATFLRNAAKKFARFWNIAPNAEGFSQGAYRTISVLSFGPVLVLAIVAAFMLRGMFMALLPIYLMVGYFTFVHMITIASLRYRLPLEPFLILLAAWPLSRMLSKIAGRPENG